ncbi:hypothetical protein C8J57DRAFT_1266573 [Mycena rebaudengoi]|nr:hypothetical protein C8J57DRAFT_1266573 [Mycena rebaudengoi]
MTPRPILKALPELDLPRPQLSDLETSSSPLPFASCSRVMFSPHVHFPSTPGLALTGNTHSPGTYDRAPIAVSPNSCALPERGERVYCPTPKGSYFHPLAFEACAAEPDDAAKSVPPLLPDLSSETDEWEECVSPPTSNSPEPRVAVHMLGTPYYPAPIPSTHSQEEFDHALSFLPHPPTLVRDPEKRKRRKSPQPVSKRSSAFCDEPDDCLGGF